MRRLRKVRDDRFALTTLQNPLCEVRIYAELVQAAQRERENQPGGEQILIATHPNIKKQCKPLKTINSDPL